MLAAAVKVHTSWLSCSFQFFWTSLSEKLSDCLREAPGSHGLAVPLELGPLYIYIYVYLALGVGGRGEYLLTLLFKFASAVKWE